jgi:hypothetical protein
MITISPSPLIFIYREQSGPSQMPCHGNFALQLCKVEDEKTALTIQRLTKVLLAIHYRKLQRSEPFTPGMTSSSAVVGIREQDSPNPI